MKTKQNGGTAIADPSNDAAATISFEEPWVAQVKIQGVCPIIFHRWSCESVEAKSKAKKGSDAKKTDDVESYVYRDAAGLLCIPGEYLRQAVIHAAKFLQDPRSPRKSAMDLFKAGIAVLDELCPIGTATAETTASWDYLDRRRVMVQRNGITRVRPAFLAGWKADLTLQVLAPEYISEELMLETLNKAGRLVGIADNRPSYGRFQVTGFQRI